MYLFAKRFLLALLLLFSVGNLIWGIYSFFNRNALSVHSSQNPLKSIALSSSKRNKFALTHLEQIQENKQLRVGMINQAHRFNIDYFSLDQLNTFEIALLKQFANYLKVDLIIYFEKETESLINRHLNGDIDLIASDIKGFDFDDEIYQVSIPYNFLNKQLIYKKPENKINQLSKAKQEIVVPTHSSFSVLLKQQQSQIPNLTWQETNEDEETLFRQVADGKIDYTIVDDRTFNLMQRLYPEVKVALNITADYPATWFFYKEDESLLSAANTFIQKAKDEDLITELQNLYPAKMTNEEWVIANNFTQAIKTKLPPLIPLFKKYGQLYQIDWKMLAAISYQESHWNPLAKSATGVRGLMMLTQATAETMGITNREDSEQSVLGGAKFLNLLIQKMDPKITLNERILFALVAYNMGYAHLLDAQRLARNLNKDPNQWFVIEEMLPLLTKKENLPQLKYGLAKGYQAFHYVQNIQYYYSYLVNFYNENEHPLEYLSRYDENNLILEQAESISNS